MTSNPLSGSHSKLHTDFTNLQAQLSTFQNALNSGNQNQVNASKSTFSTALSQVIGDLSNATQGQSASSANPGQHVGSGRTINLQNDLQTLQTALDSIGGSQGSSTSLANALSRVQSDVNSIQKGHHHYGQQHGGTSSGKAVNNNDTLTSLAALFSNGGQTQNSSVNIQA